MGRSADDHDAGSRRHLRLPDPARAVPLAAARGRKVVHARDRRRAGLRGRELVHDEQHELHADRAATINQTFFWRLRATSSTGGVVTDWSETRQYDYTWSTVPTLLTPADAVGTPLRDITFSWSPVVGAKTYQIQISPNGDWDNNVIHDATIKSTKYTLSTNLNNGSYYWRVRAKDAKGTPNNGLWSNERQFTRNWPQHPDEVAPFYDGITTPIMSVPTLEGRRSARVALRDLDGTDLLFSPGSFVKCFTNRTKVTPYTRTSGSGGKPGGCAFPYSPGTTYYWKVRAIDAAGGIIGIFSKTNPPDTGRYIYIGDLPNLVAPADNATVEVPTFIWDPVPNIERYVLTVKKQNGTTALSVTTYATSYTPPTALNAADGPFSWYVTTIDGNGEDSVIPSSADWFHFSLTTPLTTSAPPIAISSPGNGASYARMPQMSWSAVNGATYYKVWYGSRATRHTSRRRSAGVRSSSTGVHLLRAATLGRDV